MKETIIVVLQSVRRVVKAHESQPVNYPVATKMDVGLLLNFGEHKVKGNRKVRTLR